MLRGSRIQKVPKGSQMHLPARHASWKGRLKSTNRKYISYTKPMEKGPETLREFTGLLFLTFTET